MTSPVAFRHSLGAAIEELRAFGSLAEVTQLTLHLYRLTKSFPRSELFGLTSQIRRASGSIGANLAEGCGRWSDAEMARYVQIAMGSASELNYHIRLAHDLHLVTDNQFEEVSGLLTGVRHSTDADSVLSEPQRSAAEYQAGVYALPKVSRAKSGRRRSNSERWSGNHRRSGE